MQIMQTNETQVQLFACSCDAWHFEHLWRRNTLKNFFFFFTINTILEGMWGGCVSGCHNVQLASSVTWLNSLKLKQPVEWTKKLWSLGSPFLPPLPSPQAPDWLGSTFYLHYPWWWSVCTHTYTHTSQVTWRTASDISVNKHDSEIMWCCCCFCLEEVWCWVVSCW